MDETTENLVNVMNASHEVSQSMQETIGQVIVVLKDMQAAHQSTAKAIEELDERLTKLENQNGDS